MLATPVRADHSGHRVLAAHRDVQRTVHRHEPERWKSSTKPPGALEFAGDTIHDCAVHRAGRRVIGAPRGVKREVAQKSEVRGFAAILRLASATADSCLAGRLSHIRRAGHQAERRRCGGVGGYGAEERR